MTVSKADMLKTFELVFSGIYHDSKEANEARAIRKLIEQHAPDIHPWDVVPEYCK